MAPNPYPWFSGWFFNLITFGFTLKKMTEPVSIYIYREGKGVK
jgi:hypothetical protein